MEYYQLDVSRRSESYRDMFTRNSVDEKKELWGGKCRLAGAPHKCVQNLKYLHPDFRYCGAICKFGHVRNVELCSRLDQL
jgi:hypothetical protein